MIKDKQLYEIPDFTGYYINKQGQVFSTLAKGCRDKYDLTKRVNPKELTYRFTKTGYARVMMRRDSTNKREDVYVHRIMAELFLDNPNNLSDVNHKDSNPANNRLENLEWLSHKDNLTYGELYGHKGRNKEGKFTYK